MVLIIKYSSNQINSLSNSLIGNLIYDSTLNTLRFNNSTNYNNVLVSKDLSNNINNINTLSANTLSANTLNISTLNTFSNLGINTSARDYGLEINHQLGNCLRLTVNDNDGNPTTKCDFQVTSMGTLTISPAGNNPHILMSANLSGKTLSLTKQNVSNNTVDIMLNLTGLPNTLSANGIGTGIEFGITNNAYTIFTLGTLEAYSTNVTDNSETGGFRWRLANNGELNTAATLSANGTFTCTTLTQLSDIRLKENILPLNKDYSKSIILKII